MLATTGWTSSGETVSGNAHWYRLADGWVWAGGTTAPVPALGGPVAQALPKHTPGASEA